MNIRSTALGLAAALSVLFAEWAQTAAITPAEFLYQLAQEYRQTGREDEAIHELRKLLLIDPNNRQVQQELAVLEQQGRERERAIGETLAHLESSREQAREAAIHKALREVGRQGGRIPASR